MIASVVVATIGASPAYAVPDRASMTNGFSGDVSVIGTATNVVTAGGQPVGVAIPPAAQAPPPVCDLAITKSMSPMPLVSGQQVTVTLTVVNVGMGACTTLGTVISDNKPPGLTFTSTPVATPPAGWYCSLPGGNALCSRLGVIPAGTVTVTFDALVTASPGEIVTNCAQVETLSDGNQSNNRSCVTKRVGAPVCDLAITKSMSPMPLVSGQQVTVTLTVVNVGGAACATEVIFGTVVSDKVSPGLTSTSSPSVNQPGWSCGFPGGGDVSCSNIVAPFSAGGTVIVTFTALVTALPGMTVTNCAEVFNLNDTNSANNQSCVTELVA